MSDSSASTVQIDAPLADVAAKLYAIDAYPTWLSSIKKVEVVESDDQGRALKANVSIDAGVMKDRATLIYDWSSAPSEVTFSLDEADMLTEMSGGYELKDNADDTVTVTYELHVELSMPVPDMMRTKAERETIDKALNELKSKLEA